jgi:hypothetical protein
LVWSFRALWKSTWVCLKAMSTSLKMAASKLWMFYASTALTENSLARSEQKL